MDHSKDMPNEEIPAAPEQPALTEEETDVAAEAAQESVPQEAESLPEEEAASGLTETPADEQPTEEAAEPASDEEQTPVPDEVEAPTAEAEPPEEGELESQSEAVQTEDAEHTAELETAPQTGEALVEILDAAQPSTDEEAAPGEQAPEGTEPSSSEPSPPPSDDSPTLESVIEAILFATDEPLPEGKLAGIVETTGKQVRECVESLNARYEANHNAFRIEQIAGGYQMLTQPIYNSWLKKMLRVRSDSKLSPAAMETLAIIAYKQPIIRADIEAIRGVAVGEVIRSLMYKGLVKIAGRAEILGRPMLYGTTKKFLEIFGLNSVKDLPKAEDLKNPDRG